MRLEPEIRYLKVRPESLCVVRHLRIPEERLSVLIGHDGATIEELRALVTVDITLDGNEVVVEGEPFEELRAANIVKAIGRGFAPERAFRLLEDNADLCVLDVTDFASNDSGKERLKGRVIGRNGEAREKLENDTNTEIAVYGKTVAILGPVENVAVAREAVVQLLQGRSHATVYNYLDRNQAKITR